MPTRNALERLAAAGRPLLADAESLVDEQEQERILERILASDRQPVVAHIRRHAALVLAGAAIVAAAVAVVATGVLGGANRPTAKTGGHRHVALTGPRIKLAGFHFRTPAGFKASSGSCVAASPGSGPVSVTNGFAAAASAEGGCIEAFFLIADSGASTPAQEGAEPVSVGDYQAFFVPENSSGESTLYVQLPTFAGGTKQYLMLVSEGLSEEQLVAVAQSGLPSSPTTPAAVTG